MAAAAFAALVCIFSSLVMFGCSSEEVDNRPLRVVSIKFVPSQVNADEQHEITIIIHLWVPPLPDYDFESALRPLQLTLQGPNNKFYQVFCDEPTVSDPAQRKSRCETSFEIPVANANGVWTLTRLQQTIEITGLPRIVYDENWLRKLNTVLSFTVLNSPIDLMPPRLIDLLFTPPAYFASGESDEGPRVCIAYEDRPSGLNMGKDPNILASQLRMKSTNVLVWQPAIASFVPLHASDRFGGQICAQLLLPIEENPVYWEVEYLVLVDDVGNAVFHTHSTLQDLGLPVHFYSYTHNDTGIADPEFFDDLYYI